MNEPAKPLRIKQITVFANDATGVRRRFTLTGTAAEELMQKLRESAQIMPTEYWYPDPPPAWETDGRHEEMEREELREAMEPRRPSRIRGKIIGHRERNTTMKPGEEK